jgi:predicted TPR repeat methyltransferase
VDDSFEQAKAHFFAALGRQQAGDLAEAERGYRASLALVPGRASTLINLAAVQLRLARPVDALASADAALAAEHGSVDALLHRATALAQLCQPREALATFQRLLAIDPHHAAAWSGCGTVLREAGRLDEAADAFREALRHGGDAELNGFYLASVQAGTAPPSPPSAYVAGLFDHYAEEFDSHLVGQLGYQAHRQVVDRLVAAQGADARFESALDLGCGTGLCGVQLQPLAARIDGVDLAANMLAQARQRGVYERLEQGDVAAHLASTDRCYDLVAAADVFTYVGALDDVFAGVARVLQADGLFGFAVEAADDAPDGFVLRPSLRYAHARGYLEALAQRHGFGVRSLQRQPIREDQRTTIDAWYGVLSR